MARPRKPVEPVNRAQARLLKLGVTGSDIARALGVTAPAVQRWLAGTGLPSPAQRKAIEERYGVSVADWLFMAGIEAHLERRAEETAGPALTILEDAERRLLAPATDREF